MNWKEQYREKLRTPDEAVKVVKSGDFVRFAWNSIFQTCWSLAPALAKRAPELENVTIDTSWSLASELGLLAPGTEKSWKTRNGFVYGTTELAKLSERDEQTNFYTFWQSLVPLEEGPFREDFKWRFVGSDVMMVMITPPDKNGIVTFGHHLWGARRAIKNAKIVIGEVNDRLPIIPGGDNWMSVGAFDFLVESNPPNLYELLSAGFKEETPDEAEASDVICGLISAELINDGDCLMFGGGAIPIQIEPYLEDKNDLGCHTEVIVPLNLIKRGVINNKYRNLVPGKVSCTGVMTRSKVDEEFINGNPIFDLRDSELNNHPLYFGRNDNLVAINAPLEINLFGEINIERVGYRQLRGVGGQVEMVIGALSAKNGRSIHGVISRKWSAQDKDWVSTIVPQFTYPGVASIPRHLADFIVTEHGIARLLGKTEREKAEELITVAHPDYRAELRKETKKLFYR
jgi:4-hydroxybutyrate CoA-transferase